ncbi:MAG: hypothetical protein MUF38_04800 [Anaerolineae bacterium]|nr:hypothetical protein [Anaerolineae bacterium]
MNPSFVRYVGLLILIVAFTTACSPSMTVRPGGAGISGTITTNIARWQPTITADDAQIAVQQGNLNSSVPGGDNVWEVNLGADAPLMLTVNSGRANTTLDLGGLALDSVSVTTTAGSLALDFSSPTSQPGQRLSLTTGQTNVTASRLLNADFAQINGQFNDGRHTLSLDGRGLQRAATLNLQLGSGALELRIPDGVRARITFRSTVGRIQRVDDVRYTSVSAGVYETVGFADSDAPILTIDLFSTTADLILVGL